MKKFKIGLQLYSVRDHMQEDMDATLKAVAEMGYDCVEFAGYFEHTAAEVRGMLEKYGLEAVSVHQRHDVFLEGTEAVEYLKELGVPYCAIPHISPERYQTEIDTVLDEIRRTAELLKENGIQLLYHNHDFEFLKVNGKLILDTIYDTIPPELLQTEIDTCWVHYAGYAPDEYLRKYKGRAPLVHLKDFECKKLANGPVYQLIDKDGKVGNERRSREDDGFEFRPVGYGRQDIPALLEASEEAGADYLIVEQDGHNDADSLEDARKSIAYLKSLGQ